tara:strand:- start:5822 stop:5971 length:150 start_codon:yes stop_codon:yes gene_type:complete
MVTGGCEQDPQRQSKGGPFGIAAIVIEYPLAQILVAISVLGGDADVEQR